jgi:hypothetical protein
MILIIKKNCINYCNVFDFIEYPYLINPPTLRSATYDRIIVELNFKENSITKYGEKILNIKYYQLFYKVINNNYY